jgi:hypothetical protein
MAGSTRLSQGVCDQFDEAGRRGFYITICRPPRARAKAADPKEKCFTVPPAQLVDGSDGPLVCSFDESQRSMLSRLAPALVGLSACDCGSFERCEHNAVRLGCHDCPPHTGLDVADVGIGVCQTNTPLVFFGVVFLIMLAGLAVYKLMRWDMHSTLDDLLDEWISRGPLKWCRGKCAALAAFCCCGCTGAHGSGRVAPGPPATGAKTQQLERNAPPAPAHWWNRAIESLARCKRKCKSSAPKVEPRVVQVKAIPLGTDISPTKILGEEAAKQKGGTPDWW